MRQSLEVDPLFFQVIADVHDGLPIPRCSERISPTRRVEMPARIRSGPSLLKYNSGMIAVSGAVYPDSAVSRPHAPGMRSVADMLAYGNLSERE